MSAVAQPHPGPPGQPAPTFTVLGAEHERHALAPTLRFTVGVSEPEGREVYTIALSTQINVEPARRAYDAATRERLVDLFGAPERWAATTHSFPWTRVDTLVQSFTGASAFTIPVACTYDMEVAAAKYLYGLLDGAAPLAFHFTGTLFYRGDDGRMQLVKIPWTCSASYALAVDVWRAMMNEHYPHGTWVRLHADTLAALERLKTADGLPTLDATVEALLSRREDG